MPTLTTPAALVAAVAAKYDGDDGEAEALQTAALRCLQWRAAHGGKHCDRCDKHRSTGSFGVDSRARDGLRRYCRDCVRTINAEAYRLRKSPTPRTHDEQDSTHAHPRQH